MSENIERVLGDGAAGDIDNPGARPAADLPPAPVVAPAPDSVTPQEETDG